MSAGIFVPESVYVSAFRASWGEMAEFIRRASARFILFSRGRHSTLSLIVLARVHRQKVG